MDQWGIDGKIDLLNGELILLADARRYKVEECIRVVVEVSGAPDAHAVLGKVKSKRALSELGAEILENSMILGDNAYDVVPGWFGTPSTPLNEFVASPERAEALGRNPALASNPPTDEALLQSFVQRESVER